MITTIKQLRLCGERDRLVDLLKQIGKENNVAPVIRELSGKYSNMSTILRYMTRLRNKVAEEIQSMEEQASKPYFESEQFKQELAEDLNGYNRPMNMHFSTKEKPKKVSYESLYKKEIKNLGKELSVQNAKREEFEELIALATF
jgi:hypothetical protein